MVIKLICPKCGSDNYVENLDILIAILDYRWSYWIPYMSKEKIEFMEKYNNKERLEKILSEQGFIKGLCDECVYDLSIESYKKTYGDDVNGCCL